MLFAIYKLLCKIQVGNVRNFKTKTEKYIIHSRGNSWQVKRIRYTIQMHINTPRWANMFVVRKMI